MTLSDFNKNLSDFALNLLQEREKHALTIGNDAIALIARRVQGKGVKASGVTFKIPYSKKHEKARKAIGLPINYRNLTFTGKMWASIIREKESETINQITIVIKSKDYQGLVNKNSEREETNILSLADIEIEHLQELTKTWLDNELRAIQ